MKQIFQEELQMDPSGQHCPVNINQASNSTVKYITLFERKLIELYMHMKLTKFVYFWNDLVRLIRIRELFITKYELLLISLLMAH
jgi:hypothetical protein